MEANQATGRGHRRNRVIAACMLATGLALTTGCAGIGKARTEAAKPAPVAAAETPLQAAAAPPAPVQPAAPVVAHFANGREGFVITEPAVMDPQVRRDFEHGSALIREEKYDKGIELLEKVIERAPELTAPHVNAAIAYSRMNRPEQAERHLKKALELIPGHPVASNEYGLLLRKGGRFAESRDIYEKSLAAFPEYHPIHRNLGILCDLYLKDPACAVEHYEVYGKAVPKDQQVKLWLAELQSRPGSNLTASAKR